MTVQFRADRISYAINCLRIDHRLGRIRRTKRFVAALPLYCHRIADIAAGPIGVTRHVRPSLTPATMRQEHRSVTFAPRRRCPRRVARAGVPACRGRRACAAARRSFNHRRGQAMRRAPRVGRRSHVAQRLAPASSAPAAAGRDGYVRLSLPQLARVSLAPICAAADDQILSELWDLGIGALRAGYCEWIDAHGAAPTTLGWSWFVDVERIWRIVPDSLTSNLMIISAKGYDVGPANTRQCLLNWLTKFDWRGLLVPLIHD
nr:DUF4902 domain-containing protein [Burkholderia pseudomallei]